MTTGQLINGASNGDVLLGAVGDDTIIGKSGNDSITGGDGNDQLFGDDVLDINARTALFGTMTGSANIQVRINGSVVSSSDLAVLSSGGQDYYVSADFLASPSTVIDVLYTNDARYYNGPDRAADRDVYLNSITGNSVNLTLPFQMVNADGTISYYAYDLSPGQDGGQIINLPTNGVMPYGGFVRFIVSTNPSATGDDTLDGGVGADTMSGGGGNDTYYVDNVGDVVREAAGFGYDTVYSSVNWTMGDNIEKLVLQGPQAFNGTGNAQANLIVGNGLDNVLDGGAGADTLTGGAGNDVYVVDDSGDVIVEQAGEGRDLVKSFVSRALEDNVEDLTLMGIQSINATGNGLDNVLSGNSGENVLDGVTGADTLIGGDGNDTYIVNSADDKVIESSSVDADGQTHNSGVDLVMASVDYALGDNVENLTLMDGATQATGNALDNVLIGNAANNMLRGQSGDDYLDGGLGADTLDGGTGSDTYVIDSPLDVIIEDPATAGVDTVVTGLSFTLGAGLENLQLTGDAIVVGRGNDQNNVLISNEGNTENGAGTNLYGMAGNDTLIGAVSHATDHQSLYGGAGDDYYQINVNSGRPPRVVEYAGEGVDTIYYYGGSYGDPINGGTYVLPDNVENGIRSMNGMRSTAVSTLVGNGLGNVLTGSLNSDKLMGMAGNDTLYGGFGQDTLDGGTGDDLLVGGVGNDVYVVDSAGDVIKELKREGTDTVQSFLNSYSLGDNLENLQLKGAADSSGTGNDLNNVITGNSGSNTLDGMGGADTLIGGDGADTYYLRNTSQRIVETMSPNAYTNYGGYDNVHMLFSGTYDFSKTGIEAVYADAGAVNVTGNNQGNNFIGGAGNDRFVLGSGDDYAWGAAGNDTLISGGGYDVLAGGAGQDTYMVDMSKAGITELNTWEADADTLAIQGVSDKSKLHFQRVTADWGTDDAHPSWDAGPGTSVLITADGVPGSIAVDLFNADGSDRHALQAIQVGGSSLSFADIKAAIAPVATSGNDYMFGFSTDDALAGGAGDDWIDGAGGIDTLIGGDGTDRISGTGILDGGTGNDTLSGFGLLNGGDGNDYLSSVSWWGSAQSSQLIGGAGDDVLSSYIYTPQGQTRPGNWLDGGTGNDSIYLSAFDAAIHRVGDGRDVVSGSASSVLKMDGTKLSDLLFARERYTNNLVIANAANTDGDRVTVRGSLNGIAPVQIQVLNDAGTAYVTLDASTIDSLSRVGNVLDNYIAAGASGSYIDGQGGNDWIEGGVGNDTLYGSDGADRLSGGAGNNLLDGGNGDDTLTGGVGSDTLIGGAGKDILTGGGGADLLNGGQGNDTYALYDMDSNPITIQDSDATVGNSDSAVLWANPYATVFKRAGNDLQVSILGSAAHFAVKDWFLGADHHVENFNASGDSADGSTWYNGTLKDTQVQSLVDAMATFSPSTGQAEIMDQGLRSTISQAWSITAYSNNSD